MKKFYFFAILFLFSTKIFATHAISGEISFTHISGFTYEVGIVTYTRESSPADRPFLIILYGDGISDTLPRINGGGNGVIVAPDTKQNIYTGTHIYPGTGTYIISFEDANRDGGIVNIPGSVAIPFYTESQLIIDGAGNVNNSVQFLQMPIINGIIGNLLTHNVTAYDPDGDCLTFELTGCRGAGGLPIPGYTLPNFISIDSINGEITWVIPALAGKYSFAVKVNEWRNGVMIGYVVRDFEITVQPLPPSQYYFSGNSAWQTDANGNYSYTLFAGDTLELTPSYTDSFAAAIDINAYGEVFSVANPALFFKTLSMPTIGSLFRWVPDISNVRSAPYIVTFRGFSDNIENDISLLIHVVDGTTQPCYFTTSIAETGGDEDIRIFPNPTNGIFTIYGLHPGNTNRLIIYDPAGRIVKDLFVSNHTTQIDISKIADGFYLYELRNSETVVMQGKLIKK